MSGYPGSSSRAAVVVRQKDQGDLYRSGQSLAKRFHRVVSQQITR